MNITLVGSGNVAFALARAFAQSGQQLIIQSRNEQQGKILAGLTKAHYKTLDTRVEAHVDLVIICVKDNAITEVTNGLILEDTATVVAHTSGTASISTISYKHSHRGIFYPLQSFNKELEYDFSNIPVCINAEHQNTLKTLNKLAQSISKKIFILTDEEREKAHLSAVISNNFTNHLITQVYDYLEVNHLPRSLVIPLIMETFKKLILSPIDTHQTGPAARNDLTTIERHKEILEGTELEELYDILTKSILKKHNHI